MVNGPSSFMIHDGSMVQVNFKLINSVIPTRLIQINSFFDSACLDRLESTDWSIMNLQSAVAVALCKMNLCLSHESCVSVCLLNCLYK